MNSESPLPIRDPGIKLYIQTPILCLPFLLVFALLIAGCDRTQKEPPPTPQPEVQPANDLNIPDTEVGLSIVKHFDMMFTIGPNAEDDYQRSLDSLRTHADEAIDVLTTAYNETDKIYYGDRWTVVQTLSDIRSTKALDALTTIAREPLPRRDSLYAHELSPYNEESIIRITALNGIANLSVESDTALNVLVSFFDHKDAAIRMGAINALADAIRIAKEPRKKLLLQYLPRDYSFVEDVSRIRPPGISGEDPNLTPDGKGIGPAPTK